VRVKTNQQHLALLITEILHFVQVGSGRVTYSVTDVSARESIQYAIELIEPLFGQKSISFDGISGDASIVARADRARVTQILVNLLSNAIKFTPPGGHVGADCAAEDETVTMSISDTGIGIPAEKHQAIFEPFIQLKETFVGRDSGVGLGLAISRDLARAMKGDLTVESAEGKGARFTLSLPRARHG
jgi:signal transduction histidine kinase